MSLDEPTNWRHAEALERSRMQARADRALDWADQRHELELRDAVESVEAEETHWAGVFAADPYPDVTYDGQPGVDRRMFNVSGLNHASGS